MSHNNTNVQKLIEEYVELKVGQKLDSSEICLRTNRNDIEMMERHDFLEARRMMKMWPVRAQDDELISACRRFLEETLEMPHDTAQQIGIESVRKIRQARRSKVEDEILVKFRSIEERDVVQSYAPNLSKASGATGVRMELSLIHI